MFDRLRGRWRGCGRVQAGAVTVFYNLERRGHPEGWFHSTGVWGLRLGRFAASWRQRGV